MAIFHCQVWLPGGKCCYILFIFTWGNGKNMEMKPPPIQIDNLHCMISGRGPRSNSHINLMRVVFCFKQSIFSNKSFHLGILEFLVFSGLPGDFESPPIKTWAKFMTTVSPREAQGFRYGETKTCSMVHLWSAPKEGHGIGLESVWNRFGMVGG